MADKTTISSAIGIAFGTSRASGSARAGFVPTGRWAGRKPAHYTRVMEWAKLRVRDQIVAHPAAAAVRACLIAAPRVTGDLSCYRGCISAAPLASACMGPPKNIEWPTEKRYALPHKRAFYLCLTEEEVTREVKAPAGEALYVQRFQVPSGAVTLADLRDLDEENLLNDAFMFAEMACARPESHASMVFTQVLAELVCEHFEGMVVPGVKGDADTRYCNVVIFASDPWREWLDPARTPTKVVLP